MRLKKIQLLWVLALLVFTPAMAPKALADTPGPHPAYLHALTELRYARALLDQHSYPAVVQDQNQAIHKIDAAIGDIKQASIDDRKPMSDHPAVDTSKRPHERFQDALAALNRAYDEINRAEDVPQSRQLKSWALRDIDAARSTTQHALSTAKWDYQQKMRNE